MQNKVTKPKEARIEEQNKKPFEEPKLTYVQPKLTKHGKATQVTQTYFGSFSA